MRLTIIDFLLGLIGSCFGLTTDIKLRTFHSDTSKDVVCCDNCDNYTDYDSPRSFQPSLISVWQLTSENSPKLANFGVFHRNCPPHRSESFKFTVEYLMATRIQRIFRGYSTRNRIKKTLISLLHVGDIAVDYICDTEYPDRQIPVYSSKTKISL